MTDSTLKPLIVKSLARSGSTLLMNCLSQIEMIVVALQQPCEVRYAQYLASAYELLTARADLKNSARPNFFYSDEHKNWIGRNPFNRRLKKGYAKYFDDDYNESVRMHFADKVEGFYRHVAKCNGVDPGFFCEKVLYISQGRLEQDPDAIHRLFPDGISAIYLVRDPRDVICSNRAFFHAGESTDVKSWCHAIDRLGRHTEAIAASCVSGGSEHRLIVHYERLVQQPEECLQDIAEWLGIQVSAKSLEKAVRFASRAAGRRHRTSASASESVRRWSSELPAEARLRADRRFTRYMKIFGYD